MAESADILSGPHQKVILPNPAAGCSMADMANIAEVEECWETLETLLRDEVSEMNHGEHGEHREIQREETGEKGLTVAEGQSSPASASADSSVLSAFSVVDSGLQPVVPVTYMNSAADLKAFCGSHGGIVCTSSNAEKVLRWAFERGRRVLFFPDEHLGRNTALAMGIPEDEIVVWNQRLDFGGIEDDEQLVRARVILWKGWCSTHQRFAPEQIAQARKQFPGVRVVVHPECRREVVRAADLNGSTEYIVKVIEEAPAGTIWAVGTEINLVRRLANEHPEQTIFCLDPVVCPCSTMYRVHPAYLAWVLEALIDGRVINQVSVDEETARWARVALERMLANKG
jgi:quinolinate synthase